MPKWLSTAGNQFNSWGFPQVPYSGPGLCRTRAQDSAHTDPGHQTCREAAGLLDYQKSVDFQKNTVCAFILHKFGTCPHKIFSDFSAFSVLTNDHYGISNSCILWNFIKFWIFNNIKMHTVVKGLLYRVPECLSSVHSSELGPPILSLASECGPPLGYWEGRVWVDDWTDILVLCSGQKLKHRECKI